MVHIMMELISANNVIVIAVNVRDHKIVQLVNLHLNLKIRTNVFAHQDLI